MKRNNNTPKRGRPRRLTDGDIEKIETAALADLSLTETASVLRVSRTALTNFLSTLPEEKKTEIQALRGSNGALAKLAIRALIEQGDVETCKWYLSFTLKREAERVRSALLRAQRAALEPQKETLPEGLPSLYWQKVDEYFTHKEEPKPEPTEAGEASNTSGVDN